MEGMVSSGSHRQTDRQSGLTLLLPHGMEGMVSSGSHRQTVGSDSAAASRYGGYGKFLLAALSCYGETDDRQDPLVIVIGFPVSGLFNFGLSSATTYPMYLVTYVVYLMKCVVISALCGLGREL